MKLTKTPSIPCRLFDLHSQLMQGKAAPEDAAKLVREAGVEILRLESEIKSLWSQLEAGKL